MADDEIRMAKYGEKRVEPLHGPRIRNSDQVRMLAICDSCAKYGNDRGSIQGYHSEVEEILNNTIDATPNGSRRLKASRNACYKERIRVH